MLNAFGTWVVLTDEDGQEVYVNVTLVTHMERIKNVTRLHFGPKPENSTYATETVKETPEAILSKALASVS